MQLTKHHGLGNDFLVLVDLDRDHPIDPALAVAVCDRHRGVGADGLLFLRRSDAGRLQMILLNGDGSRAEMSGNGISCLAQAAVRAGLAQDVVDIETDAGHRSVEVVEGIDQPDGSSVHRMRVAMGVPSVRGPGTDWIDGAVTDAVWIDTGNPHLVCHTPEPPGDVTLEALGRTVNQTVPAGANVEFVHAAGDASVTMSVYERGVGLTEACGTGAVASAVAANRWGLVPTSVTVHQPGGDAVVELGQNDDAPAHLTVPVASIATVEWPW